jgi:CRP-like cAMP-binding protein
MNLLLASLPTQEQRRLSRRLERVVLHADEHLHELGQPVEYVHFPKKGCLISVIKNLGDDRSFDAGPVGYEGFIGLEPSLGIGAAQFTAIVRNSGSAHRMKARALQAAIRSNGKLRRVLQRYAQYLLLLTSQIAGCNMFHSLERHFCSWLLVIHDRIEGDQVEITHAAFANMLGVRRVGITQAAQKLKQTGLIGYRWGKLTILDRQRLEDQACVCYREVTEAYQRLLDPAWPYR